MITFPMWRMVRHYNQKEDRSLKQTKKPFTVSFGKTTITIDNTIDFNNIDSWTKVHGNITDKKGTRKIRSPQIKMTDKGHLKIRNFDKLNSDDRNMVAAAIIKLTGTTTKTK